MSQAFIRLDANHRDQTLHANSTPKTGRGEQVLRAALAGCSTHLTAARVFSGLLAVLTLAPSIYMMQIYDRVLVSNSILTLVFLSVLLLATLVTHAILDETRQRLLAQAALRLDLRLGGQLMRHGFDDHHKGDAQSAQVLREFDGFRQGMQGPVAIAMMDLPYAPLFVIVAFMLHPWLGMLVLAGSGLLVCIAVLGDRATSRAQQIAAEKLPSTYASTELSQVFGGAARALGMRPALIQRLLNQRDQVNEMSTRNTFVAARYASLIRLLRMGLQSTSLGLGAYLVIQQQLSPGALIAASILTGRALAPVEQVVSAWRQMGQKATARKALVRFLDTMEPEREHTILPAPAGAIAMESVSARVGEASRLALHNISFAVAPGECLGILGPSGAGKSTLGKILVGAQHVAGGTVRLDGSSLLDWDTDVLGKHIGYVPQEIALFAGTVAENIRRFAPPGPDDAAMVTAAQEAGAHAMIQRLSRGYDTPLGPRGQGLSAGQSQRVALARALFGAPNILVLDEPNSHLDSEGDGALLRTLQNAKARGATIVIITHRAGILPVTDKLLVLNEGRVEHFGPREQVLASLREASSRTIPLRPPHPTRQSQ